MTHVMLLIGTRKGAFLAFADPDRRRWTLSGPFIKGVEVPHVTYAPDAGLMVAATKSFWWGAAPRLSTDFGTTWREPTGSVRFAEDRGLSVERIWIVQPAMLPSGQRGFYAGVDPGALFLAADAGDTWQEVRTLTDHPTRKDWQPGAGGLAVRVRRAHDAPELRGIRPIRSCVLQAHQSLAAGILWIDRAGMFRDYRAGRAVLAGHVTAVFGQPASVTSQWFALSRRARTGQRNFAG